MVVAQRWKVVQFQTIIKNDGLSSQNYTAAGSADSQFYFRLSRFDESKELFEYRPTGVLRSGIDETGICTAHGKDQKTQDPWPGQLWLNDQLVGYSGFIDPALPQETTPLTCGNTVVGQAAWQWIKLITVVDAKGDDYPRMAPDDTQLTGSFKMNVTGGSQSWDWTFQADVVY